MARRVSEFVERMRQTPFVWGRFDCIINLADWSFEIGAGDPAAAYRGRYSTVTGAGRIIRKAGGLKPLVAREFEACCWAPATDAQAGDIGIVQILTDKGPAQTGGLCLGDKWAVFMLTGVLVGGFKPFDVWRSPCLKL